MTEVIAIVGTNDLAYELRDASGSRWCPLGGRRSTPEDRLRIAEDIGAGEPTLHGLSNVILSRLDDDEVRKRLSMPMLEPALKSVIADVYKIDRVSLVVTDQQPAHPDDTADVGRILGRLISEYRPDRIAAVDPARITLREHPQKYDHVYGVLRRELLSVLPVDEVGTLYVVLAGGIPASRDALRQHAFNLYRGKVTVIQVSEASQSAERLSPDPYMRDVIRQSAEDLVRFHQYGVALQVLEGAKKQSWPEEALSLLRIGADRVNLDFQSAAARKVSAEIRDRIGSDTHRALSFVAEVRFLVEHLLEQRRYADALYRVALFWEFAVWLYACHCLDLPATLGTGSFKVPESALTGRPVLAKALRDSCDRIQGALEISSRRHLVSLRDRVTSPVPAAQGLQRDLQDPIFDMLQQLRNTVVHHGRGISETDMQRAGGVGRLKGILVRVVNSASALVGEPLPVSRYRALNEAIAGALAAD